MGNPIILIGGILLLVGRCCCHASRPYLILFLGLTLALAGVVGIITGLFEE